MTPETLEELVLTAKGHKEIVAAFSGMADEDRKALSTNAQKLFNQLNRGKANAGASEALKRVVGKKNTKGWGFWNWPETQHAALAVYACGPLSAASKQDYYTSDTARDTILSDRKPEWLGAWVDHELEKEWTHLKFPTIRRWIKAGACDKPSVDGYYRIFAQHMMSTGFYERRGEKIEPISKQLLAEPELMEDIEGLFRVETNAFNTNSWFRKGANEDWETWSEALKTLSDEGHYPRSKLLDLALTGLRADIKQNQLSGYAKFIKSLEPTKDELLSHQSGFIDLLCSQVGLVQKFAVDMLSKVEASGKLDTGPATRELSAVFAQPAKGTAIAALKLLEKILKRSAKAGAPDPAALDAVSEALAHENSDVQVKAMALLDTYSDALTETQWERISEASGFILASNRAQFAALLAKTGAAPLEVEAAPTDAVSYEPLAHDILSSRVLFDEDRIEPIASLDELIDAAFHAVETVDSPDEIERIIDAISRFADQRPADFKPRVAPMVHRLSGNARLPNQNSLGAAPIGVGDAVRAFVYSWATGELHGPVKGHLKYYSTEDTFVPMIGHLHAMAERVNQGMPRQPLASPTHRGGWIDPLVWVERLDDRASDPNILKSIDLQRSMLRLAPDNRAEALKAVADMEGDIGRLARFALGSEDRPTKGDAKFYPAWISAARARDPMRDWSDEFAVMRVVDDWPGGAKPAVYVWSTSHKQHKYEQMRWKTPEFSFEVSTDGKRSSPSDNKPSLFSLNQLGFGKTKGPDWKQIPSAAANRHAEQKHFWSSELNSPWISQLMPYGWPLDPTGTYFRSARSLIGRIDEDASGWSPSYGLFDALFLKGRPWGEAGHLLLCVGLVGKDADARALSIDVMIEGIDNRTFDPEQFGQVMTKLAAGDWLKLNRVGASLTQVAQASPLHANVTSQALQAWLPECDLSQRNGFHLLECLREANATSRAALSPAMRANLETLSGKGKAAKLAKELLA